MKMKTTVTRKNHDDSKGKGSLMRNLEGDQNMLLFIILNKFEEIKDQMNELLQMYYPRLTTKEEEMELMCLQDLHTHEKKNISYKSYLFGYF